MIECRRADVFTASPLSNLVVRPALDESQLRPLQTAGEGDGARARRCAAEICETVSMRVLTFSLGDAHADKSYWHFMVHAFAPGAYQASSGLQGFG
jgi:hypothetical protein